MERPGSQERICRLCLGTLGYFVNIFDNQLEMGSMATKIMRCAAIEVKETDGLPDSACHRCVAKLESSYDFRLLCETSDAKIRRLLVPKITDAEKYGDVEREQKKLLECEITEETPNEISSDEITILFVSSKKMNTLAGNMTKTSDTSESALEAKNRQSFDITSEQESAAEDLSEPHVCSKTNNQVLIDTKRSDKCRENTINCCVQDHFDVECNGVSVIKDDLRIHCAPEKHAEWHSCLSPFSAIDSLENTPKTEHIKLHEKETRTCDIRNECSLQSSPSPDHLQSLSPTDNMNTILTSEAAPTVVLNCENSVKVPTEGAREKQSEASNSLSSREPLSVSGQKNNSDMGFEYLLSSNILHSDIKNIVLHDQPRNISELEYSDHHSLQTDDSVADLDFFRCQRKTERSLKLCRQSRHTSTENAAVALIMLSNSADNSIQECDTLSTSNEDEPTTCDNACDQFETSPSTASSVIQVAKYLLHNDEIDTESNSDSKSPENALSNESINVKIKCVSGKYSVEKVHKKQLNISNSITTTSTNTASRGTHKVIVSEEDGEQIGVKEDSFTIKELSANLSEACKISLIQQSKLNRPLPGSIINTGGSIHSLELNRHSGSLKENTAAESESSAAQANPFASESTIPCEYSNNNLTEELSKDETQAVSKEISIQKKICHNFTEAENHGNSKDTNKKLHTVVGLGRSNLIQRKENIGNVTENIEGELYFRSTANCTPKSVKKKKPPTCSNGNRGFSNKKKKKSSVIKRKCKYFAHHETSIDHQHQNENNTKVTHREINKKELSSQREVKAFNQIANENENISVLISDINSCNLLETDSVCSDKVSSSEHIFKNGVTNSESDIPKHEKQNESYYSVWENSATSAVNPKTLKTNFKTEIPLKELKVLLVRLEIDSTGTYKSSETSSGRVTSTLSSSRQNVLRNPCSSEGSTKKRALHIRSCVSNSNTTEAFKTASAKESPKKSRRGKNKRTCRAAMKLLSQEKETSKILTTSPVNNSSVPSSSDISLSRVKLFKYKIPKLPHKIINVPTEECKDSNKSICALKRENAKWKPPGTNSEETRNALTETIKTHWKTCSDATADNVISMCRSKAMSASHNIKNSKQRCTKSTKEYPEASSVSFDSTITKPKFRLRGGVLVDQTNDRISYQKASNNAVANPVDICREINVLNNKGRKAPVTSIVTDKLLHNELSTAALKFDDETKTLSKNSKMFTPVSSNKIDDLSENTYFSENMQENTFDNNLSVRKLRRDTETIMTRHISKKNSSTSKTLTIESYRKLRQLEFPKCSKINYSNNNYNISVDRVYSPCCNAKSVHHMDATTEFGSTNLFNTKPGVFPKHENVCAIQTKLVVQKNLNSVSHYTKARNTKSVLHRVEEPWSAPPMPGVASKTNALRLDEKSKTYPRSVAEKDKQFLCPNIIQSANQSALGNKRKLEKCRTSTNIFNDLRVSPYHDGDDDQQCKIIIKEILKTAYLTPQLAVLTADSPRQSPTSCFEVKPPQTEPLLPTFTNECYSSPSRILRSGECIENVASLDSVHKSELQVLHLQNKNHYEQRDSTSNIKMESSISYLDSRVMDKSSRNVSKTSNVVTAENIDVQLHEVKSKNNLILDAQNSRETSERSSGKCECLLLSCTTEARLEQTNDIHLQNFSNKNINCKENTTSLASQRTENENKCININVKLKQNKEGYLAQDLSAVLPKEMHSSNNATESFGNKKNKSQSEITNCTIIMDSRVSADSSELWNNPNTCTTEEEGLSSETVARTQDVIGNVNNASNIEHKFRKTLENKIESNEREVKRISEQNTGDCIETSRQANSPVEKERSLPNDIYFKNMSITSPLQCSRSSGPLSEKAACKAIILNIQEFKLQETTEINAPAPLSFTDGKMHTSSSKTYEAVTVSKGEPVRFPEKDISEQKYNSIALDATCKWPSEQDNDMIPVSVTAIHCKPLNSNNIICSEVNIPEAPEQNRSQICPASISSSETAFDPLIEVQLQNNSNNLSNGDKNNENKALKRVCYTSNFMRKDLSNGNILPKSESNRFIQPKSLPLKKAIRKGTRSKSQENCSNNIIDSKFWMYPLPRKLEDHCLKFRDCNTLREVSNQHDQIHLREEKLTAEPISASMVNVAKSRVTEYSIGKYLYNPNRKRKLETPPDIDRVKSLNIVNFLNSKETSNTNKFGFIELKEEIKSRDITKANLSSASNATSVSPNIRTTDDITSQLNSWAEANCLSTSKDTFENRMSRKLLPEESIKNIDVETTYTQNASTTIIETRYPNAVLQSKTAGEVNTYVCDMCRKCFASHHIFMAHQRIHEMFRKRACINNNHTGNGAFRACETYLLCSKRTNRPFRQRWRGAQDYSGRFRIKRNVRQYFHRKTGFRNNGKGAATLPRINEKLPAWKSKRCKICHKWFSNYFQFSQHFKKCCR